MRTPHPVDAAPRTDRRLLDAKLTPPAASHSSVSRAGLADVICSAQTARLVLIRAAAGFGKTTLMMECRRKFEQMGLDAAWLTLDRSDNDASRFLAVLHAALAPVLGVDDDEAPRTDPGAREPSEIGMAALELLNRVAVQGQPFVLFLDDFEVISEPGVHSLVRELIDAMPRHSRLVIGTRTLPELRLGRLRAQDQLLEVDASQLRFTLEETVEFLAMRRMPPLETEDLVRLHRKTEGWAAALWLASIALERSEDRPGFISKFSGSDRAVAEYLAEEVLARQPPEVRDFLQRTSVLKQLEPGICDYVLERNDSADVLASLERTHALLVRLGEGQHNYRYHSMFAGFLREQLARSQPAEVVRLHRKAAQWYMAQGRPVPAIDHALESGETGLAVQLLEAHAAALLAQGRMRILSRWFAALPPTAFDGHPQLVAIRIWALCFTRGSREATALLEDSGIESDPDPQLKPHLLALKPLLLAMMDRYEEAYAAGRESLAHLPTGNAFADMVLANAMTTVAAVLGQQRQARRLLDSARRGQGQGGSSFNVMYSEAAEGIIDLEEGRLRQATARFRLAMNATVRDAYGQTHGNSWAGLLCAIVCYESNELDRAAQLLHVYLPIARDVQLTDQVIVGYALLARISFNKGDIDHALQTLAELEYLGHQRQLPRLVVSAQLERARLHLCLGHHAAAREELARADDRQLWERIGKLRLIANDTEYLTLGQLRWEAVTGDASEAARRLDDEIVAARADARHRRALKLSLLRAIALHRDNRPANAHELLREVLKAASAEGYMRLILDEDRPAGALLRSFVGNTGNPPATGDPIFNDYLRRLEQAFGAHMASPEVPAASHGSGSGSGMVEPLTRKELRVLQLLAEGYSNNAIAEKLFVSDSTVRTHLRNVNAKLATHSRTQAVAMARRLGLLV
jgi:LuxR family maltose regulon positive regulatory protein